MRKILYGIHHLTSERGARVVKQKLLTLFGLLFLIACFSFSSGTALAEEVVVGCSLPFTGGLSSEAPYFNDGYKLGIDMINEQGGLLGKKVKLIIQDDQTDPANAITIYEKLVTKNKAIALLGPLGSSVTAAAAGVAEKYRIPIISSYAASESLYTKGYKYHFGVAASKYFGGSYSVPFIDMVANFDKWGPQGAAKPTKIAIIGVSGAYGRDAVDRCVKRAKEAGLDIVHEGLYDAKTGDFTPMLQKIKNSGAQVLCAVSYYNDSVILARGIAKLKMKFGVIFLGTGPDLPEWKELGPIGYKYCSAYPLSPAWQRGGYPEFVKAFKAKYGKDPIYSHAWAYGVTQVLKAGVEKAQSLDPQKIRDAIAGLEMDIAWCQVKFAAEGWNEAYGGTYISQNQKGKTVGVYPPAVAEAGVEYPFR